jgi:RNA polymerase sigma-70 factor (ECF subfamily)
MALAPTGQLWRWASWLLAHTSGDTTRDAGDGARAAHQSATDHFEHFIRQHEQAVLNYLWHMLGDEQGAFDLAQETFLRAWQHYAALRDYAEPRGWLFRVASHLAISQLRRARAPVGAAVALDEATDPSTSDHAGHLAERDLVRQVLDHMTPQRRAALVLREVYGFSCEQIAQILETTPSAIKTALWRAREQFRSIYIEEDRA